LENPLADNPAPGLDTRLLTQFILELNICRRHVCSYPENHPIIAASTAKIVELQTRLLGAQPHITIGIAKDSLLVGNAFLDRKNQVNQDFARLLFGHGIAAITFTGGLAGTEIIAFCRCAGMKKDAASEGGGLPGLLSAAGVTHIQLEEISYAYFRTTEELPVEEPDNSLPPWEAFVHGLLCGTLAPEGARTRLEDELDPAALALLLNDLLKDHDIPDAACSRGIADLLRHLHREDRRSPQRALALDQLCLFVSRLNPQLRRLFLSGAFQSLEDDAPLAEDFFSKFPYEMLYQALDDVSKGGCYTPPFLIPLLRRLCRSGPVADSRTAPPEPSAADEMREKLSIIFREDRTDAFVPNDYQETLRNLRSPGSIQMDDRQELESLKQTLESHHIETSASAVILEMLRLSPDPERKDVLAKNLADLCSYFVQMGDFGALSKIYREAGERPAIFADPTFLEDVLKAPELWGKEKFPEIRQFISLIGSPFAVPLLNKLAEENNMSLRRFFIDRMVELGDAARDAALSRLRDERWYFVRNLLLILRSLNDPSVTRHIRSLLNHPHPKVRMEAMKTLLHFQDPQADRLLQSNLAAGDEETLLAAVQLAEYSANPQVCAKLVALLDRRGIVDFGLELKSAVVRSLAEIGNPVVLPDLEKVLQSKSILHSGMLSRLKLEIVRSLERYPQEAVMPLLQRFSAGSGEIAGIAADLLRTLRRKDK
jgi:HEAT repeat protein